MMVDDTIILGPSMQAIRHNAHMYVQHIHTVNSKCNSDEFKLVCQAPKAGKASCSEETLQVDGLKIVGASGKTYRKIVGSPARLSPKPNHNPNKGNQLQNQLPPPPQTRCTHCQTSPEESETGSETWPTATGSA